MVDPTARRAAEQLLQRVGEKPEVALVLGSGLGDLAEAAQGSITVSTSDVPGYPRSTVAGHRGQLVFGRLEGVPVGIVQGRAHVYEGHSTAAAAYAVRLMGALGARKIVLTNAAGGINPLFRPGSLMLISDHLNFSGTSFVGTRTMHREASLSTADRDRAAYGVPLRFRDRITPYSSNWIQHVERQAARAGIALNRGVYVWVRGPSYETKAEIRAFRLWGGDAVGMSTVPEALQAAELGMDILGVSTITNPAAGLGTARLSHEDVLATGRQVREELERLIREVLHGLDTGAPTPIPSRR